MSRRPTALAAEENASPALVRALRTSEAALAGAEALLVEAEAVVERQARDLAALQLRKPSPSPSAGTAPSPAKAEPGELLAAREEIALLKAELAALKASTSWRVTSPLRSVTGLVRR